jgi:hypothetical protein
MCAKWNTHGFSVAIIDAFGDCARTRAHSQVGDDDQDAEEQACDSRWSWNRFRQPDSGRVL